MNKSQQIKKAFFVFLHLAGIALIFYGVFLIYLPASFISLGALLLLPLWFGVADK